MKLVGGNERSISALSTALLTIPNRHGCKPIKENYIVSNQVNPSW